MKKLLILIVTAFIFASCTKGATGTSYYESFITGFNSVEASRVSVRTSEESKLPYIQIESHEGVNKVECEKLWKKYNDISYNRSDTPSPVRGAFAESFLAIDLVSDKDFGDTFPAGASLAENVTLVVTTPYPYIKNDYKGEQLTTIKRKMNKFTQDDLYLLTNVLYVNFESLPTVKGLHKMKLIITKEDGTKAELPFEIDFK